MTKQMMAGRRGERSERAGREVGENENEEGNWQKTNGLFLTFILTFVRFNFPVAAECSLYFVIFNFNVNKKIYPT